MVVLPLKAAHNRKSAVLWLLRQAKLLRDWWGCNNNFSSVVSVLELSKQSSRPALELRLFAGIQSQFDTVALSRNNINPRLKLQSLL